MSQKLGTLLMKPSKKDLQFLKELIEAGKVKLVIDRTWATERFCNGNQCIGVAPRIGSPRSGRRHRRFCRHP